MTTLPVVKLYVVVTLPTLSGLAMAVVPSGIDTVFSLTVRIDSMRPQLSQRSCAIAGRAADTRASKRTLRKSVAGMSVPEGRPEGLTRPPGAANAVSVGAVSS